MLDRISETSWPSQYARSTKVWWPGSQYQAGRLRVELAIPRIYSKPRGRRDPWTMEVSVMFRELVLKKGQDDHFFFRSATGAAAGDL